MEPWEYMVAKLKQLAVSSEGRRYGFSIFLSCSPKVGSFLA